MAETLKSNLEKMKGDLDRLEKLGELLWLRMLFALFPDEFAKARKQKKSELEKALPSFNEYQRWYSEALRVVAVLLPDRLADFKAYYQLPRPPKELTYTTYTISDYLRGTQVTRGVDVVVDRKAAQTPMEQQLEILRATRRRFESSLFDIRGIIQADLFGNELDAAAELNKKGFQRGAGAIAGVVLEGHLAAVCANYSVAIAKRKPTLADYYEALRVAEIIDQATWRFIQHLADVRNACDHKGTKEPTRENVDDLIEGVRKVSKTIL